MNATLAAALAYAKRGWRVFPILEVSAAGECACREGAACDRAGKHPAIKGWNTEATTEVRVIRGWWAQHPNRGVGIATGELSGLTVLDVDGDAGVVALGKLAEGVGMPPTPTSQSRPGRFHYYFHFNPAIKSKANTFGDKLDTRGEGGYVVAPPSRHATGSLYTWLMHPSKADLAVWPEFLREGGAPKRKPRRPHALPIHLTIEQVEQALACLDPDDEARWAMVGWILGRSFNLSDEAFALYARWAARSRKYNAKRTREHYYKESQKPRDDGAELTMRSFVQWAQDAGWQYVAAGDERYDKFWAVRQANKFLYLPTGELWITEAINALLPPREQMRPALWLMRNRGVDSVVFDPALDQITRDKVAREQGVIDDAGSTLLNRYRPATVKLGSKSEGRRWRGHLDKIIPNTAEADHIELWCAQRVQRPGVKVRHAILMGGEQGVGKDTVFEALIPALGAWNCASIAPDKIFESFNEFAAKVLVRINEVVDLHEISRYKFLEATKTLIAGSPDYVEINPKYAPKYYVRNCAGIVMTTNHPTTGVYLPADDRRHFVVETIPLWGTLAERTEYFLQFWNWLIEGDGYAHVAAYLHSVDISKFNPNAPPPNTECFAKVVANGMSNDSWLIDALEALGGVSNVTCDERGMPKVIRLDVLRDLCTRGDKMKTEHFSIRVSPALARAGYELLPNALRKDLRHSLKAANGTRCTVTVYVARGTPAGELGALLAEVELPCVR